MKILFKLLLCATIVIVQNLNLKAQIGTVFLDEDFEGTINVHTPPENWAPDSYSDRWFFWKGGWDQFTGFHNPSTAHSGNFNAMFKDFQSVSSKLESPPMDLRGTIKPILTFWYAQELRSATHDKLKVYYRPTLTADWELLESYLNPTLGWVKDEIILPDEAKTQYCQLAFEGTTLSISWGVCIDDIKVEEKGLLQRQVESLSLIQSKNYIPRGSSSNQLGALNIKITGNSGFQTLQSMAIDYSGTDINDINLASSELYYTKDTIFSTKTKLNPTISPPTGNTITFSNINKDLQTGENYIWICVSVKSIAPHNDTADIKLQPNSINISNVVYPGSIIDPLNYSIIEESLLFDGFESLLGWTNSPGACWQFGIPTGIGTNDPNYSFSGVNVLATNLSGNYPSGISPSAPHTITTPNFNAKYYQNINLRFSRWLNFEFYDKTYIQCSVDGGTNWINVWENSTLIQDFNWKKIYLNISQQANRKENVKIRFSIDSTDPSGLYGGWNIDNFAVTGDFIAKDVGVSGIISPITKCGLGSNEIVKIKIKNYGGTAINESFDVAYSTNNGLSWVTQTINPTIPLEEEYIHEFSTRANLSLPGLKNLKFKTIHPNDEDSKNDVFSSTIFVYPSENYIYESSFELSNKFWNPSGTNSSWAWGIISKPIINTASHGTKGWATNIRGNHNISESSYLESPCFDFTNAEYPVISFDYRVKTDSLIDGFRLDYSIDGGDSWMQVDTNSHYNQNWCTGSTVTSLGTYGWSGKNVNVYKTARTLLPIKNPATKVVGKNNVKFRFVFKSNTVPTLEGVVIDNIKIYELPYDVGVLGLSSPTSGCYIGLGKDSVNLDVEIKNFGYRPLKPNLKIPMEIKLRNNEVVKDTFNVGATTINQNGTATFTTAKKYWIISKGKHILRLNTNFLLDLDKSQDTLKPGLPSIPFNTTPFELEVTGIPGYSLGPDKAVIDPAPASISVEIDAGLNGIIPYNNYLWSTTETTRKVTVNSYGTYSVTVTNENACTATDTIDIIVALNDIQILPDLLYTGLNDACEQNSTIYPQIKIKNGGPGPIGYDYAVKSIPLSIMVDSVVIVNETFTFESSKYLGQGRDTSFTFTTGINIPNPKKYDIRIYSKINEDWEKTNDTLKVSSTVWGLPDVNLPFDTIADLNASVRDLLDAGPGFRTYTWQDGSHNQTFDITSNNSAWYKVTVEDIHFCGSDKDSVYINAKDLKIISLQNPNVSFCDNEVRKVAVVIQNSGNDNFETNEIVKITYNTPEEVVSKDFILLIPLIAGTTKVFSFDNPVKLPIGFGFVNVQAKIANDSDPANNTLERTIERRISPTVSFDPSTISRIFDNNPYVVSPIYGSSVLSYQWQDSNLNYLSFDSLYSIVNTPPGRTLNVNAYEYSNQLGCHNIATLNIIADDIALDAIKSPSNRCELINNTPVILSIANRGNFTYVSGTSFSASIKVDGVHQFTEPFILNSDLDAGSKRDISLIQKVNLSGKNSAFIEVSITSEKNVVETNDALNKTVIATGYPSINLGANRTIHDWNDTLRTGSTYELYSWTRDGVGAGTDSVLVATQTGTYRVTVTDFNGCEGISNDITLTFVVDDIALKSLDSPISSCGLKTTESVIVTVENSGTIVIPSNTAIEIGFTQDGLTKKENFILSSNLNVGATRSFNLAGTMNLPLSSPYPVKVWVKMGGDIRENNDTLQTSVEAYPVALFTFIPNSVSSETPYTINAGVGFSSYLWSTGSTSQSITVTTTGDYWAEVSNSKGCTARDTIHVKIGTRDISVESLVAPITSCSLLANETIKVKLKNTGTNIIPSTTIVPIALKIDNITVANENYPLSEDVAIGASVDYTFTYKHNFTVTKTYSIEITTSLSSDEVPSNNKLITGVTVKGRPSPNLGPDKFFLADTVISPGTFSSYLWHDNSTNPTFNVTQTGTYSVTVTDANGCSASDDVLLTKRDVTDIRITALTSPSTNCYNALGQTVTATITNKGSRVYTSGENIKVTYQINSETPVEETLTFTSNFVYNQSRNFEFSQKAMLNPGAVSMVLKTIIGGVNGVPSATYPIAINANPSVDLGPDRTFSVSEVLNAGPGFTSYTWQDNSHNQTFTATATGNYSVTVTNASNCQGFDEVHLTLDVSVETIPGTNAKVTLFPNPVNDELTIKIETDIAEVFTIDFVNPQGQVVKTQKTEKATFAREKFTVNGYTPGIYFIKVSNNKGSAVFKVIVQR